MTDQEIICTFMEPKPQAPPNPRLWRLTSSNGWWLIRRGSCEWRPHASKFTFDALWEVEERLLQESRVAASKEVKPVCKITAADLSIIGRTSAYERLLRETMDAGLLRMWHATAEQKIKALAAVLRPVVEAA